MFWAFALMKKTPNLLKKIYRPQIVWRKVPYTTVKKGTMSIAFVRQFKCVIYYLVLNCFSFFKFIDAKVTRPHSNRKEEKNLRKFILGKVVSNKVARPNTKRTERDRIVCIHSQWQKIRTKCQKINCAPQNRCLCRMKCYKWAKSHQRKTISLIRNVQKCRTDFPMYSKVMKTKWLRKFLAIHAWNTSVANVMTKNAFTGTNYPIRMCCACV